MAENEPGFEAALARLEEIVALLERGEAPLESTLELFEEGVGLSRRCRDLLEAAEDRVRKLVREKGGSLELELFPDDASESPESS